MLVVVSLGAAVVSTGQCGGGRGGGGRLGGISVLSSQCQAANMLTSLLVSLTASLSLLAAPAGAQYASCPEPYGLQVYPHDQYCDKFYKCANGKPASKLGLPVVELRL